MHNKKFPRTQERERNNSNVYSKFVTFKLSVKHGMLISKYIYIHLNSIVNSIIIIYIMLTELTNLFFKCFIDG